MASRGKGIVYLVGAGPGDPGLLTMRAHELLAAADVVAYDELCSDALLAAAGPDAQLVPVGRRGHGRARAAYRLHPAVLELARAGKRVVRLKAGDPFVFGRGGEEAEELALAGIPFEVVPGVSSALGAAAYAGIPLTHRCVASDVTFATGHDLCAGTAPKSDWRALGAGRGTIVLFMAGKNLAENLMWLIEHGRASATPAAYVAAATTARQRVVVGTVGDLAERVAGAPIDAGAPALVIVGEVVALRAELAWIERRPLWGRRVLVGRARPGRSEIAARLRALGAEALEAPEIGTAPPASFDALDRALVELGGFAAVVFACAEGVAAVLARLGALGRDVRALPAIPFFAVGPRAASALRERGLRADMEIEGACGAALAPAGVPLRRGRLLMVAGEGGRPGLASALRAHGARVELAPAYRTTCRFPRLRDDRFDLVIAPSSSAALHLTDSAHAAALRVAPWLVMGPRSEAAARGAGVERVTCAAHDDVGALVRKGEELLA